MDPALYDEDKRRAQLLRQMRAAEASVYAAAFAPPSVSSEPVLVAATSTGMLHVYKLRPMLEPAYWEDVTQQRATAHPGPNLSFQAHPTQIYSLAFAGDASNPLLISGGDQDFRVWRWRDVVTALDTAAATKGGAANATITPLHVAQLARETVGFRGALLPLSEINDVAVDQSTGHVFLAGGDSVAHEWDVGSQRFVRQFVGHSDCVHTLQHLTHSHELVTGSEDGTIRLWDARQARQLERLQPQLPSTTTPNSAGLWVGSVANDASEVWLACGGGQKRAPGHAQASGFVGMWHLPSRVPIHCTATSSDVHAVTFHHLDLLSIGNDAQLSKWNRSSGARLASARSTVPSSFFCAVDAATDIVAIGGSAPVIDVYAMPGVVSFSLLVAPAVRTSE